MVAAAADPLQQVGHEIVYIQRGCSPQACYDNLLRDIMRGTTATALFLIQKICLSMKRII